MFFFIIWFVLTIIGELFAACPIDSYPSTAVENVSDSARYFVLRIKDESGRTAFIGIGFVDRSDSFDFNVALQDHFKFVYINIHCWGFYILYLGNHLLIDNTKLIRDHLIFIKL